ncbi:uncharacterized protein MKK02DRAFT_42007 [Dioszegia hungarica]|uniref:VWFA domain-containing protein n=1 Tax=Dioszegia hungarica TaxID=4972 RepID=A0AA38HFC9_9TREE|nr:uncharacterized protein MKK02DRAFT_42007 [Dioszegia hungarica]KAI9638977.1 hypothetical protein MKK02DRAFT_42007 [Dioszegia hungarica]
MSSSASFGPYASPSLSAVSAVSGTTSRTTPVAMYRAASHVESRPRYNVEPMVSNASVHWALLHRYARDPEYVKAVIRSYIEVKKARGRLTNDISMKLNYIEQDLPQHAEAFHAVRAEYRLPPSRVLPASTLTASTSRLSSNPSVSRISQSTPPHSPRRSTDRPRPSAATPLAQPLPAEFRVRPDAGNEELPPPPYARQDPEPDSTRMLQERLAAEAQATLPPDTAPPSSPAPRRTEPIQVWPTPPGPPPQTQNQRAELGTRRPSQAQRPISPPHPPEDDEIARAYEENQLEEAKRASMIAERERLEVEEAMRLSMADAGPSRPSGLPPHIETDEGLQRRVSSYAPTTLASPQLPPPNRRVVSDYQAQPEPDVPSMTAGMSQLSVPGGPSLMDFDEGNPSFDQPPMVPQKTGAVIQSRNPFFHPSDDPGPSLPSTQLDPSPVMRQSSDSSFRDQAGSSRTLTSYSAPTGRALPRIPRAVPTLPEASDNASVAAEQPLTSADDPAATTADVNDPLHALEYYQTVFIIDDSPSIAGEAWQVATQVFSQVAHTAMKYSAEGIDVYFTNSKRVGRELRTADDVEELLAGLQARGTASTGHRLKAILRDHTDRLTPPDVTSPGRQPRRETKPMNLIIITDGVCARSTLQRKQHAELHSISRAELIDNVTEDDLEGVIVQCAKELDRAGHPASQIGIQLLQIGQDLDARAALQELDDGLAGTYGIRDMVDLVVHDEAELSIERINKVLFGGIDRNWDDYTA